MNVNQIIYVIGMMAALIMVAGFDQLATGFILAIVCGFTEVVRVLTHIARGTRP